MALADDILKIVMDYEPSEFVRMLRETTPVAPAFPKDKLILSPLAEAMQRAAKGNKELVFTNRTLGREARDAGLRAVPDYNVLDTGVGSIDVTKRQRNAMLDNVEALLAQGDPNFYIDANTGLAIMNPDMPVTTTSVLTAPFSAGTDVGRNMELSARFIENPALYPGRTGAGTMTTGPAYRKALRAAMLDNPMPVDLTESDEILKVGSFAENLADPYGSMRATVDRHAVKAPMGAYVSEGPNLQDPRVYRFFEGLYKEVASKYNLTPSQAQSAVWDAWRRLMQVNSSPSMLSSNMFTPVQASPIFSLPADARERAISGILQEAEKDAATAKKNAATLKEEKEKILEEKKKAAAEKKAKAAAEKKAKTEVKK